MCIVEEFIQYDPDRSSRQEPRRSGPKLDLSPTESSGFSRYHAGPFLFTPFLHFIQKMIKPTDHFQPVSGVNNN